MKIWIDGYEANILQRLGSGQVACGLLNALEEIDEENEYTILLPNAPLGDLPKEREGWHYKVLRPSLFWTRFSIPLALFKTKQKPDLIFSPTHYIPQFSPVKKIVTIFDLSYLHFPEMFEKRDLWKLTNWTKYSILNSDHIITISNFSKQDIIKNYGISDKKITVAYPGFNSNLFSPVKDTSKITSALDRYNIVGKYIIFVGTLQPRKNIVRLIEVIKNIPELRLVIIGKGKGEGRKGWKYQDIVNLPLKLNIEDRILFLGFVQEQDLKYLYSGAEAFILPSLWEGFGIPVLEAMATGTPVIVSNVSSLPEIVENAGLLVDPYSNDQIEQAIRLITTDKKLHLKLSKEGIKQAKKFSWINMAKKVLEVF